MPATSMNNISKLTILLEDSERVPRFFGHSYTYQLCNEHLFVLLDVGNVITTTTTILSWLSRNGGATIVRIVEAEEGRTRRPSNRWAII